MTGLYALPHHACLCLCLHASFCIPPPPVCPSVALTGGYIMSVCLSNTMLFTVCRMPAATCTAPFSFFHTPLRLPHFFSMSLSYLHTHLPLYSLFTFPFSTYMPSFCPFCTHFSLSCKYTHFPVVPNATYHALSLYTSFGLVSLEQGVLTGWTWAFGLRAGFSVQTC